MLQISDKQAHNKGLRNKNPINAKCVQLIELHAFACCLLSLFLAALLGYRRVTVVTQQWQVGLPLPSLLGYFTSSNLIHTDNQRFTKVLVQIWNTISILNVINQQISRNIRAMLFLFFFVLFSVFLSFVGAKILKYLHLSKSL